MTDFIDKDFNNWWNDDPFFKDNPFRKDSPAYWAWEGWQAGLKVGMKREHALWVLAKIGQEIEHVHTTDMSEECVHKTKKNEHELEYCPHGRYINYSCNSCDAEEHADRIHSYGEEQ